MVTGARIVRFGGEGSFEPTRSAGMVDDEVKAASTSVLEATLLGAAGVSEAEAVFIAARGATGGAGSTSVGGDVSFAPRTSSAKMNAHTDVTRTATGRDHRAAPGDAKDPMMVRSS